MERLTNEQAKQEAICGIYKITSPTGKIYIGQSKDIKYLVATHYKPIEKELLPIY